MRILLLAQGLNVPFGGRENGDIATNEHKRIEQIGSHAKVGREPHV